MRYFPPSSLRWLALPLLAVGCRDTSVVTYHVPKESDVTVAVAPAPERPADGAPEPRRFAGAGGRELQWTAPASWKPKAGSGMRKASYVIGEGSVTADLGITAFPGDVGGDLANVNRWREQLGLAPIAAAELPSQLMRLEAGDVPAVLVDLNNGPQRLLAAIVPFDGATWFFKLIGPDALVARTKPEFVAFLQTLRPLVNAAQTTSSSAPAPAEAAAREVIQAEGPGLRWSAPPAWQSRPASAMRKASYAITAADGTVLDLSIAAFPGDVGGEAANVNRWRGQLQLPPLAPSEISAAVEHRDVNGLAMTIVDFRGGSQRLLGAIVPTAGATWFFKLMGPDAAIATEKDAFFAFLDTVRAP